MEYNPKWKTTDIITSAINKYPKSSISSIMRMTGISYSCVYKSVMFLVEKKVLVIKKKGRNYEVSIR